MAWTVSFEPRALSELGKLDHLVQRRIVKFLQERVSRQRNPRESGKPLSGGKMGLWRYRIGDYRLICHIDDEKRVVLVLRVAHRKQAYR
ncbi:MAG: type II toxin-antitoxin system RelE/ParE family toxin [Acidobacteriia bacterium]|nr:type II toxin-antitoxin system RelE/ParE family toxin [Terriglobia bacterium]